MDKHTQAFYDYYLYLNFYNFTGLNFKGVKLTVAGNIRTGKDVKDILDAGVDFVSIGRSGILHHDFPKKVIENVDNNYTLQVHQGICNLSHLQVSRHHPQQGDQALLPPGINHSAIEQKKHLDPPSAGLYLSLFELPDRISQN